MNYLEEAILLIIRDVYDREYIGGLEVLKNNFGYILKLYMGNRDVTPLVIAADSNTEEDFLKFVKQELVSRQLIRTKYFKGIKKDINDERRTCLEN